MLCLRLLLLLKPGGLLGLSHGCLSLRLPSEEEGDPEEGQHEDAPGRSQETEARKERPHLEPRQTRSRAARRPDKAIYVPRAMRDKAAPTSDPASARLTPDSSGRSPKRRTSGTSPEIGARQETASQATDASASEQEVSELPSACSGQTPPEAWDQTLSNFMAMSLKQQEPDETVSPAVELPAGGAGDLEDFTQEVCSVCQGSVPHCGLFPALHLYLAPWAPDPPSTPHRTSGYRNEWNVCFRR